MKRDGHAAHKATFVLENFVHASTVIGADTVLDQAGHAHLMF